jgi:DNA primase
MGRISRTTIDRIFETARIEEVVGEFIHLKRSGSNYRGLSPFTKEKTPSFYVVPGKQIFKDFSSGKGGSVVTFLMEHEQFTYPEALKWLAKRYNIEIEELEDQRGSADEAAAQAREGLYLVNEYARRQFEKNLWEAEEGRAIGLSYFRERGFTDETIRKFHLGYSFQGRDTFLKAALEKGYSREAILATGLAIDDERGGHDRFWGRVMFPILSMSGRVLGFGGRILRSDAKAPKYLNSPESEIYHKGKVLYGLFESKREILKQDRCLLVEGYTDVISLHQAGVHNVVSSSGTALTEEQIRLIRRLTQQITVLYDGDAAGIRASFRGIDMLLKEDMRVKVCLLPNGEDPDSFARNHGGPALHAFIEERAEDFVHFKTRVLAEEAQSDPTKRAGLVRDIMSSVGLVPDELLRHEYVRATAQLLRIEEQVLFNELTQVVKRVAEEERKRRVEPGPESTPREGLQLVETPEAEVETDFFAQERSLIKLMLEHGHERVPLEPGQPEAEAEALGPQIIQFLESQGFEIEHPELRRIYTHLKEAWLQGAWILPHEWHMQPDEVLVSWVIDLTTSSEVLHKWEVKSIYVPTPDQLIPKNAIQVVLHYQGRRVRKKLEDLMVKLRYSEQEERHALLMEHQELNAIKQTIDKALNRVV